MSAVLTLAVLAPLFGRGFVLVYDMVFAPRHWLVPDAVGLGSALPRSVPVDAVVALVTTVVPGDLVQQAALAVALFAGTLGAGRLVPTESTGTRIVAGVAYGWSAYVAERLFIGHWALLLAYAALPWVAMAALALRRGERRGLARLVLASAAAVLTPTGGILAAGVALACAGRTRAGRVALVVTVLNAPWWVPSVLHPGGGLSDAAGIALFGARGENWAGPVVSVLGLGGVWNADVVPGSRGNPVLPLLVIAVVAIALFGARALAARWGAAPARALLLLGAFGVLIATASTLPFGADVLRWLLDTVPGAGLLRDSQKWVAWWALPLALGTALGVERAANYLGGKGRAALLVGAALFPIAVLPDLAWGGWGRLQPVSYPDDWHHVADLLADDPRPGDVVALPLSAFRQFAWNDNRTQLDPAPRFLPRPTVIDDTLVVGGIPVRGEDSRIAAIRDALGRGESPGAQGIGWVLVEHGTPGRLPALRLDEVYSGPWLSLYRVPDHHAPTDRAGPHPVPVLAADFVAIGLIVAALLWRWLPNGRLWPSRRGRSEE